MKRDPARNLLRYQTGRVIALGRTFFAILFFAAIWFDFTRPSPVGEHIYAFLIAYMLFSLAITLATWRSWWLADRLAGPALAVDIAMFMLIVFATDGYTSPFYLLFTLPLLTAAIRWGWRETAGVAFLLVALYLAAGLYVADGETFQMQRFVIRGGHLMILSALLIWFGGHQGGSISGVRPIEPDADGKDRSLALAIALKSAAEQVGAGGGWLLLRDRPGDPLSGFRLDDGRAEPVALPPNVVDPERLSGGMLFDLTRNRRLGRGPTGWSEFGRADELFDRPAAIDAGFGEGLVAPVETGTESGVLILDHVPQMSGDHIAVGRDLGREVGAYLDREALIESVALAAGARERLALARDVHDSLVQFLAGAAFRVEAMTRGARRGDPLGDHLAELKRLIIEEQADLREFVSALRRDQGVAFDEAIEDLAALAAKLSRQWSLTCRVRAGPGQGTVPIRLNLDIRQLLREAVANAARHGSADSLEAAVSLADGQIALRFTDDGTGFDSAAEAAPWSLKERVDRAGGAMTITSVPGQTAIDIRLPLEGAFQ